ncbi:MAG: hypothetical protein H6652_19545 [Ardenticatenaceae bacterium]|nr:hypothetical protein [Ardenticatenaceae bacterium]
MQNLPPLPDVYTTRHITCVSCKEKFAVTEGHQANNPQQRKWRVLSHEADRINLRQEDNRQQRPVFPQPLQIPAEAESMRQAQFLQQPPSEFTPFPINCPRCGADNRNWLFFQNNESSFSWRAWHQRFPKVYRALLLAAVFSLFALLIPLSWVKVIILAIFIPFAVLGLILELTPSWEKLRESQHLAKIKTDGPNVERKLWIRGFGWVLLASAVLPLVLFILLPRAMLFGLEVVEASNADEVEVATAEVTELVTQDLDATEANLEAIANEMGELLSDMPTNASPQFEEEITTFSEKMAQIITQALGELEIIRQESTAVIETRRDEELATISEARDSALERLTEELIGDFRFLLVWFIMTSVPLFISVFIVMDSIKKYVNKIDKQLPPPLFHSVASMTRIVSWEAKQALEIEGTMHHIQWVNVERNDEGGINLVGLHRDPPEFDAYGRAIGETVRAQKYVVETDMWGRIIKATIHDTHVQRPAGGPDFVYTIPQPHDAPVTVRPQIR